MITVNDLKNGEILYGSPIYVKKPYIVISKTGNVLTSGTIEEIISLNDKFCGYYDNCQVEIRKYDLYLNNNEKIPADNYQI